MIHRRIDSGDGIYVSVLFFFLISKYMTLPNEESKTAVFQGEEEGTSKVILREL